MAAIVKTKTKKKTKAKPNTHHKPHPPPKSHQEAHKKRESSEARKESKKHSSRSRERSRSENSKKEMEQGPETDSAELEEKELIWDPEVSYVGVPLDLPEEEKEVLGELEPERKLWKTDKPIHDRTKIPKEWNWNTNEPDLARE